jgi:hypothetical protein
MFGVRRLAVEDNENVLPPVFAQTFPGRFSSLPAAGDFSQNRRSVP